MCRHAVTGSAFSWGKQKNRKEESEFHRSGIHLPKRGATSQLPVCVMVCVGVSEPTSPLWRHVSLSSGPVPGSGSAASACPWPLAAASSSAPALALSPAGPSPYCTAWTQEQAKHSSVRQEEDLQHLRRCVMTTYFSSSILHSCSLLSRQLCLSFSSPNREVAWAFKASESLANWNKQTNTEALWGIQLTVDISRLAVEKYLFRAAGRFDILWAWI